MFFVLLNRCSQLRGLLGPIPEIAQIQGDGSRWDALRRKLPPYFHRAGRLGKSQRKRRRADLINTLAGRLGQEENLPDPVVAVPRQSSTHENDHLRVRQEQNQRRRNQREMQAIHEGETGRGPEIRRILEDQPLSRRELRLANGIRETQSGDKRLREMRECKPDLLLGVTTVRLRTRHGSHQELLHGIKVREIRR